MAKMVKEKNLRKKNFTYESVANAFGTEIANKVFPQFKNKPVKSIDNYLLHAIEYLLKKDSYFTQNTVYQYYVDNGRFFKESVYIKQLPAIIQLLDLQKIKASKKIKEKYNILVAGFPYLYVKRINKEISCS